MKKIIKLPEPQKELSFPLMKALEKRKTIRIRKRGIHSVTRGNLICHSGSSPE